MNENNMMYLHIIMIMCWFTTILSLGRTSVEAGSNSSSIASSMMSNSMIAKPGCPTKCGEVTIPYPFGIGNETGCSLDNTFYVTCNTSETPPKLFLRSSNIEIYNISDSEFRIKTGVGYRCYNSNGSVSDHFDWWTTLITYTFSEKNMLTVIGCDDYGLITGDEGNSFSSGCIGLCSARVDVPDGRCSGEGCCQTSITKGLQHYNVTLNSFRNHTDIWSINQCGYAFLGEVSTFKFLGSSDLSTNSGLIKRVRSTVQVVIDWVIRRDQTCTEATECKENSQCYDVEGGGYRCKCNPGYEGNPYLDQGCQDINECADSETYPCYGDCNNTPGGYNCTCQPGSVGNATTLNGCQVVVDHAKASYKFSWVILVIAIVLGLFAILSGITGYFFGIRKRKLTRLREKFFEQNGGVLLKQKINSQGSHEAMTLFSTQQLRKATNNYSQDQIIGRGAYGVVYRGVLSDERVVAIKKSRLMDSSQAEQFINEVLILTQVIHRNVVKLLGCCLEEEVPVLVYEFISNNTLFHHLHYRSGGMSWLSWDNRLRVAIEAAGALAYLHSETIMPIIHRDVKSTNILIDENYTAKISDFGASRLVPLDHEQVTTLIQGTLGYLDPEYFNTSQLTEKSDVYSFGVVLTELITGKKPIGIDRTNTEKNLATYFVKSIEENRLFEIVEPRLLREGTIEQLEEIGNLVKRCLSSQGRDRPTMKEVAVELEGMKKLPHPWLEQQTFEESRSLVLEVEQSDLYDVPLVSSATNEWETYSGSTDLAFEVNRPR
uniref:wall-associated receptor kinase 2-like n=1 Tax=Erigeron canadensis TaxID=72917 RepID=UPI001CB97AD3|nr:wall-associated receptor kinase 2-like [Erigeron canadensis]